MNLERRVPEKKFCSPERGMIRKIFRIIDTIFK